MESFTGASTPQQVMASALYLSLLIFALIGWLQALDRHTLIGWFKAPEPVIGPRVTLTLMFTGTSGQKKHRQVARKTVRETGRQTDGQRQTYLPSRTHQPQYGSLMARHD